MAGNTPSNSTPKLNPRFVEWLMGLPLGWTDYECSATASCQSWRQKHSSVLQRALQQELDRLDAPTN